MLHLSVSKKKAIKHGNKKINNMNKIIFITHYMSAIYLAVDLSSTSVFDSWGVTSWGVTCSDEKAALQYKMWKEAMHQIFGNTL